MPLADTIYTEIVTLWRRRRAPLTQDPRDAAALLNGLLAEPAAPDALIGMAWNLLVEIFDSLGWPQYHEVGLSRAFDIAATIADASRSAVDELSTHLGNDALVLGDPASARSLFGRPDLVPPDGLRPAASPDLPPGCHLDGDRLDLGGGRRLRLKPATAGSTRILLPPAGLIALDTAPRALRRDPVGSLLFAAAAWECGSAGTWGDALHLASSAGRRHELGRALAALGLENAVLDRPASRPGLLERLLGRQQQDGERRIDLPLV